MNQAFYKVDSVEGQWNTGREEEGGNLGYKPRYKEGYFPVAPTDSQQDIRTEMCRVMEAVGIHVERQHHEVATAGQAEIDIKFESLRQDGRQPPVVQVHHQERRPPARQDRDLHAQAALRRQRLGHARPPVDLEGRQAALRAATATRASPTLAMWYIGGILKHGPALAALCCPTTNSYKRLVPGFEAPINLAYSARNRSASIRIPMYSPSPKAKRIEFRSPDPSCNGYLAFAAMLMAGLDGIENKINPGQPLDKDIYGMSPEELKDIPKMPGSLDERSGGAARATTSSCSRATSSPRT